VSAKLTRKELRKTERFYFKEKEAFSTKMKAQVRRKKERDLYRECFQAGQPMQIRYVSGCVGGTLSADWLIADPSPQVKS
jgi:hypothetical protein